jgi:hypothetical protein
MINIESVSTSTRPNGWWRSFLTVARPVRALCRAAAGPHYKYDNEQKYSDSDGTDVQEHFHSRDHSLQGWSLLVVETWHVHRFCCSDASEQSIWQALSQQIVQPVARQIGRSPHWAHRLPSHTSAPAMGAA